MPDGRLERPAPAAWAWAVAALTAAVFSRSLTAGFLDYDDLHFIAHNPHIGDVSWSGLRWMFGAQWVIWYPLTWLSWAFDRAVWGDGPFGYHLTNVLLHALNAALAFRLFDALMSRGSGGASARRAAAAFAALAFSLHPLRVESVAWASERSDVLCAAFALGTVLAWVEGRAGRAVALHALGLASKGTNVAIPLALAALDALEVTGRERPRGRAAAAALAAMLGLSAADGLLNVSLQSGAGASWDARSFGLIDRLAIASASYFHGLAKTLWPSGLEGLYPIPRPFNPLAPEVVIAALAVALLTVAAWHWRRRARAAAGAWSAYLLLMAPMAGFFKIGAHWTADRYTYIPALGFAGLAGESLRRIPVRAQRAAAAAVLVVLAALTWSRQGDWQNPELFWGAMVSSDTHNALARTYLGLIRAREGRAPEAEALFRESLAIDPNYGAAHNALGTVLSNTGRPEEAVTQFRAALAERPEHPITRYNMAIALLRLGRKDEAAQALRDELALIRARTHDPLRDSFEPPPDEARTLRLLESAEPAEGAR